MMTTSTLPETRSQRVRTQQKRPCGEACWHGLSFGHWLALFALLLASSVDHAEQDFRAGLDTQRKALADAVTRRDAAGAAGIFTSDAKLMVPGFQTVTGREAIQKFWQAGLSSGIVKGIAFTVADLTEE